MPKLLKARPPDSPQEEVTIQKLAHSRHAPMDVILRARIIVASWQGERTATIAQQLNCRPPDRCSPEHRHHQLLHLVDSKRLIKTSSGKIARAANRDKWLMEHNGQPR